MTPETRGEPTIRVTLLPRDTNAHGTIFGGVILSYIDQAGAIAARCHSPDRVVTVALKEVVFHEPVFVGDLVSFYSEVTRVGTSSISVHVDVRAERYLQPGKHVQVTEADVIFVAVDANGRKVRAVPL